MKIAVLNKKLVVIETGVKAEDLALIGGTVVLTEGEGENKRVTYKFRKGNGAMSTVGVEPNRITDGELQITFNVKEGLKDEEIKDIIVNLVPSNLAEKLEAVQAKVKEEVTKIKANIEAVEKAIVGLETTEE